MSVQLALQSMIVKTSQRLPVIRDLKNRLDPDAVFMIGTRVTWWSGTDIVGRAPHGLVHRRLQDHFRGSTASIPSPQILPGLRILRAFRCTMTFDLRVPD